MPSPNLNEQEVRQPTEQELEKCAFAAYKVERLDKGTGCLTWEEVRCHHDWYGWKNFARRVITKATTYDDEELLRKGKEAITTTWMQMILSSQVGAKCPKCGNFSGMSRKKGACIHTPGAFCMTCCSNARDPDPSKYTFSCTRAEWKSLTAFYDEEYYCRTAGCCVSTCPKCGSTEVERKAQHCIHDPAIFCVDCADAVPCTEREWGLARSYPYAGCDCSYYHCSKEIRQDAINFVLNNSPAARKFPSGKRQFSHHMYEWLEKLNLDKSPAANRDRVEFMRAFEYCKAIPKEEQ